MESLESSGGPKGLLLQDQHTCTIHPSRKKVVMIVNHGFNATLTARPGMGDQLADLLLTGLSDGNPGTSEHCLVYLVCRSASNPDVVHVTEGWTSEEDHHRVFMRRSRSGHREAVRRVAGEGPRVHRLRTGSRQGRLLRPLLHPQPFRTPVGRRTPPPTIPYDPTKGSHRDSRTTRLGPRTGCTARRHAAHDPPRPRTALAVASARVDTGRAPTRRSLGRPARGHRVGRGRCADSPVGLQPRRDRARHGGAVRLLDTRRWDGHGRSLLTDRHPAGVARPVRCRRGLRGLPVGARSRRHDSGRRLLPGAAVDRRARRRVGHRPRPHRRGGRQQPAVASPPGSP